MWAERPAASDSPHSDWLTALCSVDSAVPSSLKRFDELCERDVPCDAFEGSAKVAERIDSYRTTRYFDTGRYLEEKVRQVDALFARVAGELGIDVKRLTSTLLASSERKACPLQTVIGLDAGGEPELRLKYYWVLKAHSLHLMQRLFRELQVDAPSQVNLDQVYICGLDFTSHGLHDIKLYFALDRARLSRAVRNLGPVAELFSDSKLVCFQHCVLTRGKRQMFFHARHPEVVQRALERLETPRAHELIERVRLLNQVLSRGKMLPWIIAFPYQEGRLDLSSCNVYFHPTESPSATSG
ncbi:MAG: hypothetical protein R3B07_17425 [Polyangiaceae bacterium]